MREKRVACVTVETRDVEGRKLFVGNAVVYRSWSDPIYGMFKERFLPGAFRDNLASNPDVICTVDHDARRLLGRTSSGTLRLTDGDSALSVECERSDTTAARDLAILIGRKDIRGMSFMFETIDDSWGYDEEAKMRTRDVRTARLLEVSFVTFPAYPATDADMRELRSLIPPDGQTQRLRDRLALAAAE